MVAAAAPADASTLRVWALHLLSFVLPVATLAFWWTAPHPWYLSLPWLLVPILSVIADDRSESEALQPGATVRGWPFDAVLYALFALHLGNLALAVHAIPANGFWRVDTLVGWQLLGITSGYSGIVVAHELIHRAQRHFQWMGRVLMGLVLYEHFYTEHLRGHHVRVGTPDDPATARFGETYQAFFLRTVPGQFRSAWRLEARRLGDEEMVWWDPRLLRSRVVHGLAAEWGLAIAILTVFGPGAFVFFLGQALVAVRLLEAVNYFEHWGLVRRERRVTAQDSWDTDSRFTLYTLVGLSRHADHHAWPARPYQQLRHVEKSPKLPRGYFGMVLMVFTRNRRFRRLMTEELKRRGLGPFARVEVLADAG